MRHSLIALAGLVIWASGASPAPAQTGFINGAKVYEWCGDGGGGYPVNYQSVCTGVMLGIIDFIGVTGGVGRFRVCFPDKITPFQVKRIIREYLDRNPDKLRFSITLIAGEVLAQAYPCRRVENR